MAAVIQPGQLPEIVRSRINAAFAAIFQPPASATPAAIGDLVIEATNDTTLTFKYKGSDGVVRSGSIVLS